MPSFPTAIACLALAGALTTAPAWAADLKPNSVKSKHIKNGQVKTPDLKGGAVAGEKLAANAVDSGKVANDSLTGADVEELALSFAILQRRLQGDCPAGQAIRAVAEDGSVTCEGVGGGGSPSGPAGGDLAGSYPNPTIGVPLNLAGNSGSTPTLAASNAANFGVGLLGSGFWGLFGSTDSDDPGATGVAALGSAPGNHGLTAVATGNSGTAVDAQASGANGVALEAQATGAATEAADFAGEVEINNPFSSGSAIGLDVTAPGVGIRAATNSASGTGIIGEASPIGVGVLADASDDNPGSVALQAIANSPGGQAGEFEGRVEVISEAPVAALYAQNSGPAGDAIVANADSYGLRVNNASVGARVTGDVVGVISFVEDAGAVALQAAALTPATQAAEFDGDVDVSDDLDVGGTLTKGAGAFRIDHPLDPGGKYLSHSFVESPEMKNVYDGVATTDERGFATVRMPVWFDALNERFRYQLTVLGHSFARAIVWRELDGERFRIRTSRPGVRVSWQVTGVRDDAYARANPLRVVERKRGAERGRYLHPELFGAPTAKRIGR